MDEMKVDYILGKRVGEINGMQRYAQEIMKHAEEEVGGRLIDYRAISGMGLIGRMPGLVYYPYKVSRRARPGSIKHLCSHIQAYLLNYLRLEPSVVTCYDIYPYVHPGHPFMDKNMVRLGLRGMRKADRIIAISNFTKEEAVRVLGIPHEKIQVIHLGVDRQRFRPFPETAVLPDGYSLPAGKKIVLYVGSEQPRKNLHVLVRAFAAVRRQRKDVVLLKVGRPQWRGARRDLMRQLERLGLQDDVVFHDYVCEDVLPHFYNAAQVFVFPSLYEGFGLPPLEAMACGCPVITSNISSLQEVAGDAGIMLHPEDAEGFADAISRVLAEEDLREGMKRKGLERSAGFTWQRTAKETIGVYREILESS